jgi:4a-hydroxytetrahydrobiopterin dehydratase
MDNLQEQLNRIKKVMNITESKEWTNSNEKLEKTYSFKDFNESMNFVNDIAKIAENQNHHPDIEIKFNKVKISITDHEKGGISDKCHKFVDAVNKLDETKSEIDEDTEELQERCWKGYTQKGMKTMFGKRYPNCVKKKK